MQQTGMPANFNDLRLNADVRLEPHPLATKAAPNFAVENVVAPRRVYDSKRTRVLATVAGYGNSKATRNVSLVLNGRVVETKTVEVPENGRATVEFLSLEVPYGRNKGEVRIDSADALPADDVFYFSVERADPRHALFVHEAENSRACCTSRRRWRPPANRPSTSTPPRRTRPPTSRPPSTRSWCSPTWARCRPGSRTSCASTCAAAARC